MDVQTSLAGYTVVTTAFDRQWTDGRTPLISRDTHTVVKVRRVQTCSLLSLFETHRKNMHRKRGKDMVELTCDYAWHGSGKTQPDSIAAGSGLLTQFGNEQGFYGRGRAFMGRATTRRIRLATVATSATSTGRLTMRVSTATPAASPPDPIHYLCSLTGN